MSVVGLSRTQQNIRTAKSGEVICVDCLRCAHPYRREHKERNAYVAQTNFDLYGTNKKIEPLHVASSHCR